MIEILKAVLFGMWKVLRSGCPFSSTGHMILLNEFVTLDVSPEFWEVFLVVIQLGAILAVVVLFWNKLFPFDFSKRRKKNGLLKRIFLSCGSRFWWPASLP